MDIITLSAVSVLVGWLSTLILLSDLDNLSLLDFGVRVTGTAWAGGLSALLFGIFISWLGAIRLLALVNLARHVRSCADAGDLTVIVLCRCEP